MGATRHRMFMATHAAGRPIPANIGPAKVGLAKINPVKIGNRHAR